LYSQRVKENQNVGMRSMDSLYVETQSNSLSETE